MTLKSCIQLLVFFIFIHAGLFAQADRQWDAAKIEQKLEQLNTLGSALYIAAHPDDENTRLISYLSNEMKVQTAYLSLTRGDGGQNLIGPELGEALGVIRTQELLAARNIDGGQQFFTRANDFGYSKTPQETLNFWDKQKVLSDMVWVIRNFRPDVIINRFDHRTPGTTHGHHTTSAQLSLEAAKLAADPKAFPEQLKKVSPWEVKRIFFNTSWWFYGSKEKFAEADKSKLTSIDIGVYYPLLGKSNNELAAMARSQHKCQGFGRALERGSQIEYIELVEGEWPEGKKQLFTAEELSWSRVPEASYISNTIDVIRKGFDASDPAQSLPLLLQLRKDISKVNAPHWKDIKLQELDEIIKACLGLYQEATVEQAQGIPGEQIEVTLESVVRLPAAAKVVLKNIAIGAILDTAIHKNLAEFADYNTDFKLYKTIQLPHNMQYSSPYWLDEPHSTGMYTVKDQKMIGKAEDKVALECIFEYQIGDQTIKLKEPLQYKSVDPAIGEQYAPFHLSPPISLAFNQDLFVAREGEKKSLSLHVKSFQDSLNGTIQLKAPQGWDLSQSSFPILITNHGDSKVIHFDLLSNKKAENGKLKAVFKDVSGKSYDVQVQQIEYDHIPRQQIIRQANAELVNIDIALDGTQIGYIMGAGDKIPDCLAQVGYDVKLLEESDIALDNLLKFDAIVIGIRAYNTLDWIGRKQSILFNYVAEGGNLITQYNTSYRLKVDQIAPFPLRLSRNRVTEENATVQILDKKHPLFNHPNKIREEDFEGWVQERGLYFADEWDEAFTPLLASNDLGDSPQKGGLLVAPYGKGSFVYTGYSFFRELPAGVPGAYRLFANLLALKHENKDDGKGK